jgi:hypothetical protein
MMQLNPSMGRAQRAKNIRIAWGLATFVLFVFLTSIPFWKGLYKLALAGG